MRRTLAIALLAAVMVLGMVATAHAANTVNVNAQANSQITLQVSPTQFDFGAQNPGSAVTSATPVVVEVKSNKVFDLSETVNNNAAPADMGLYTGFETFPGVTSVGNVFTKTGYAAGNHFVAGSGALFNDTVSINIPWATDPALTLSGSIVYSAVQQ